MGRLITIAASSAAVAAILLAVAVPAHAEAQVTVSGDPQTVVVAVAGSDNEDPQQAAREAAQMAIDACQGHAKGLIIFQNYGTLEGTQAVIQGVQEAAGDVPSIGTHAVPMVSQRTLRQGVGVMAIGGRQVQVATAVAELDRERRNTAKSLVEQMKDFQNPKVVFVLSEPDLSFEEGVNVEEFLLGMQEGFGDTPIFGGNCRSIRAGEQRMGVQFRNGELHHRTVVAMAVSGPFHAIGDHTTEFVPLGEPVRVTKADGKWVLELNGRPAAEVYREIRGMRPEDQFTRDSEHPVGVIVAPNRRYNRMVLEWREGEGQDGALRFITEIPEGTMIQVMGFPGTREAICESAAESVRDMLQRAQGQPLAVMTSNCTARGGRLNRYSDNQGDEVVEGVLPAMQGVSIPFFGFYAAGEIGPIRGPYKGLNYQYQQHTFVGLTLVADPPSGSR